MIRLDMEALVTPLEGVLEGDSVAFAGVSTDSRRVPAGALFVALAGERFDGHRFVGSAAAQGAVAALVHEPVAATVPVLRVADTRAALGRLARLWRQRCPARVVAVTGSNGKTTVKQMLAAIFERAAPTLVTRGNLNNDIGVPLTLFELAPEHELAVVEMGANHGGEIAALAAIAEPDVGVVTNAGPSHLEGFGSLDGVARGKGEMFAGLPAHGTAVINADDTYAPLWRELAGERRVIDFGLGAGAAVRAEPPAAGAPARIETPSGRFEVRLPVPGRHNLSNALAATAAAHAVGIPETVIRAGLEAFTPAAGRLGSTRGAAGSTLLDDTYNANPGSLAAALEVLAGHGGVRWLVLGDMGELGAAGPELHAAVGGQAREAGVERLFALGTLSASAAEAFGAGARAFTTRTALIDAVRAELGPEVTVLVKGSRSMGMERVVTALSAGASDEGGG